VIYIHDISDISSHRFQLEEIGNKMGIKNPTDWYRVSKKQFANEGGLGFLKIYNWDLYKGN
jgi:hypothetical protein